MAESIVDADGANRLAQAGVGNHRSFCSQGSFIRAVKILACKASLIYSRREITLVILPYKNLSRYLSAISSCHSNSLGT